MKTIITIILVHWTHYLFYLQLWRHRRWFRKFTVRFRPIRKEIASSMYKNTIIMSRSRVIMSRSQVIMSSSRALCCLPSVKKQKHEFFFFVQCIIKHLLDSVFVICTIIKVSVRVISFSLWLRLITPTSTLIILDITKTSSNNCLMSHLCCQPLASCMSVQCQ